MSKILASLMALAASVGILTATGALESPVREAAMSAAASDLRTIAQEAKIRVLLDGSSLSSAIRATVTELNVIEASVDGTTVRWESGGLCLQMTLETTDSPVDIVECDRDN